MKSVIADPNVPLVGIAAARKRRNEYIEDCRRYQIQARDPNAKRRAPWKIREETGPPPPEWEFERDKSGKVLVARQLRRHPNSMDLDTRYLQKRYIAIIEGEPCLIGGEHVEHGCRVECYAECALNVHNVRGRIIEEYTEK
jgi:hypothetical protein